MIARRFDVFAVAGIATAVVSCGGGDATTGSTGGGAMAGAGYTLFSPIASTTTYLIDNAGHVRHRWSSTARPGQSVYLLDDGHLLRTEVVASSVFDAGGLGGRVAEYDWDGQLVWSYDYASADHHAHHDVAHLPNGHVVLIAWEAKPAADAIAAGRDPTALPIAGDLWIDHLVEVDPANDQIVWEWHLWDHLIQDRDPTVGNYGVVVDHPELVDVGFGSAAKNDWTHMNSVAYDAERDELLLSIHNFDEVWIIDHGTTSAEAAGHAGGPRGHGGDLLYRWGNPVAYRGGAAADQQLFGQHDARWIEPGLPGAGHVLVFNNGGGARKYSTVDEIAPPLADDGTYAMAVGVWGPAAPAWSYTADPATSMYASNLSGAQRLSDGSTQICVGTEGRIFQVTADGAPTWSYTYPGDDNSSVLVFRAERYAPDFPGLVGRDLSATGPIGP